MELLKKKATHLWQQSAPYHTLSFFVAGFLFDIFTLEEVDDLITMISQVGYLILALFLFLLASEGKLLSDILPSHRFINKLTDWQEDIFHFALGALLNAFTLYFFKSGTFFNSLIFLLFLSGLILLNEFRPPFLKHDLIPAILIHTCVLSFSVILAPTLLGHMGAIPFMLGVGFYLLLIYAWFRLRRGQVLFKAQIRIAGALAIFFLGMYFLRVFPPVPLSLKKIGIYHKVDKIQFENETRYMTFTSTPWWKFWSDSSIPFQARENDAIHVFARIFAPAGFNDTVHLEWWWRGQKGWMRTDRIPLPITGGRRDGFRGFSYKRNFTPGSWKVLVTTSDGLEIGRVVFDVERTEENFPLYSTMY